MPFILTFVGLSNKQTIFFTSQQERMFSCFIGMGKGTARGSLKRAEKRKRHAQTPRAQEVKMASDEPSHVCRSCWQSYNFPFSGQENVSQSFIDYSSASVLNIDLDDHDESLIIHSKKLHNSRPQRLVAKHQSLPFLGPNISPSSSLPETTMNDRHLSDFLHSGEFNPYSPTEHVHNFSICHPDIMYRTAHDLLREEVNCYPWNSCRNLRYGVDLSKPWNHKETYCQMCRNLLKARKYQDNNNYLQVLKHLGTTLPDISPSLLENLLQESISLETSQLHFDTFMGNSLACQVLDGSQQALLMYPSGAGLDTLNFSNILQFSGDFDSTSLPSEPVLSNQQFSLQGQIRQIDFSSFSGNNIAVGTRSQYNCSFFKSYSNDSSKGNLVSRYSCSVNNNIVIVMFPFNHLNLKSSVIFAVILAACPPSLRGSTNV